MTSEALEIEVSDALPTRISAIIRMGNAFVEQAEQDETDAGAKLDACVGGNFAALAEFTSSDGGSTSVRRLPDVVWSIAEADIAAGALLLDRDQVAEGTSEVIGRNVGELVLTAVLPADTDEGTERLERTRMLNTGMDNPLTDIRLERDGQPVTDLSTGTFTNGPQTITAGVEWTVIAGTNAVSLGTAGDNPGVVRALRPGTATVQASCGDVGVGAAQAVVTVTSDSLSFSADSPLMLPLQSTFQLSLSTGTVFDADSDVTEDAIWQSDDEGILIVENGSGSKGLITPRAVGSATVTAMFGNLTESIRITITR